MAAPGFFDFVASFGKLRSEREDFNEKLEGYHKAIKEILVMRTVNAGSDERKSTTANLKHDNASRTEGKPLARFNLDHEIDKPQGSWSCFTDPKTPNVQSTESDTVGCRIFHFHGRSIALNLSDLHLTDSKAKGLKPKLDGWITQCADITGPKDLSAAPVDDKITTIGCTICEFYKDSSSDYMDYVRNSYMDCVPLVAKTSEVLWNLRGKFQNISEIMNFLHLDGEDFHTASEGGNKGLHSPSHRYGLHLLNFHRLRPEG
jgi:hypothetical protein